MSQQVKEIKIQDLVLWTENPRDPIDENATDQDIINRALLERSSKWSLAKLAKEMGDYYDFSELPTVVFHNGKPVVYDGNRRIILGKIKFGLVEIPDNFKEVPIPDFPALIPCNVCAQDIALRNVLRKHGDSGSWDPLERDIFLHKFMGEKKSNFLILEEKTGLISKNPHLNKRFVKDEIFRNDNLKSLGFQVQNEELSSVHNDKEACQVLDDISEKVRGKKISTRTSRGKTYEVLSPSTRKLIDDNQKKNNFQPLELSSDEPQAQDPKKTLAIQLENKKTISRDRLGVQLKSNPNFLEERSI